MAAVELLLALLTAAAPLGAEATLSTSVGHYAGSDGVSVTSPEAGLSVDVDERTQVALKYAVDAVSAASFNYARSKTHRNDPRRAPGDCKTCHSGIDAISGASRDYRDTRHEVDLGLVRRVGETDLKPSYVRSQENDYLSETLGLGLSQNLFSRDTTLDFGVRRMSDVITPTWNRGQIRELLTWVGTASLTQVLTTLTELRLSAEVADLEGSLSNPYALIQVASLGDTLPVPETHPDRRQHLDLGANLKQGLGWDASLELGYRYYQDSWDVKAHTWLAVLAKQIGPLTLEGGWRHYIQTQAWFFQNFYAQPQAYMSRDLKLAAFSDDLLSVGLRGDLGRGWSADLRYGHYLRQDSLDYRLYFADSPVASDLMAVGVSYH